jgi:DNA transformation protein
MPSDAGFVAHCLELLSVLGVARARRMFGGHGVYADEHFVALIIDEVLYLKADDTARPAFEAAGCQPFRYTAAGGRRAVMAYWNAPDEAMDSRAAMLPWARLALASALRAAATRRPAAPRKAVAQARSRAPASGAAAARGAAAPVKAVARRKPAKA